MSKPFTSPIGLWFRPMMGARFIWMEESSGGGSRCAVPTNRGASPFSSTKKSTSKPWNTEESNDNEMSVTIFEGLPLRLNFFPYTVFTFLQQAPTSYQGCMNLFTLFTKPMLQEI